MSQEAERGDINKWHASSPLDILARTRFPSTAGIIAVGADDHRYGPQAQLVSDATRNAGVATQLLKFPGGHSWAIAGAALRAGAPWIAERAGLLPPR